MAILAVLGSTTLAHAQARFINLSDRNVFIARYTYQPYQSSIPAGDYNLPAVQDEGWTFNGWWKVEPGAAWEGEAGNYYVENDRGPINWDGRAKSVGFVKGAKFNAFVPKGAGWAAKEKELLQSGYRKVNYQQLGDGTWTISGNAYRLTQKTFNFDFSSHSIKFQEQSFPVPGRVAYLSASGDQWGAKGIAWGSRGNKAWVSLSTEGAQKRPFGPREPGYYRGKVTIYYTEPR